MGLNTNTTLTTKLSATVLDSVFKVREVQHIKVDDEWHMEYLLIETHVLLFVMGGQGTVKKRESALRLWEESVHICLPGEFIGLEADAGGLELLYIQLDLYRENPSRTGGGYEPFVWREEQELPIRPVSQMSDTALSLLTYWKSENLLDKLRADATFLELLCAIMTHIDSESKQDSRSALERTRQYIDQHFQSSITINELARMGEISPNYYGDLFKKTYGLSVIDYVTEQRVNRAKQLMASSQSRLKDIAHAVGYQDEFYFSRKFKQAVGVSPTIYMKNRKRKIAVQHARLIGQLLALHHIPYAAPLHPKWAKHYYDHYRSDIPVHLSAYRHIEDWESNIEKLQQVAPDLILSLDILNPVEQERLEQVGKVVYIPDQDLDWREQLQLIAECLGVNQEAEHWLVQYDRRAGLLRKRLHKNVGSETFLIITLQKQSILLGNTRSMEDVFYHDLGMNPGFVYDRGSFAMDISPERLEEIDADHILLSICQEPATLASWRDLQMTTLWQNLKAVRHNRVYLIPSDPWREYSASAHNRILDEVEKLFLRE